VCLGFGIVIASKDHFRTQLADSIHFNIVCRFRHDNDGMQIQLPGSECDTLGMIAGTGGNDSTFSLDLRQFRDLVIRAAQLEAEYRLLVFPLQPDAVVESFRQKWREVQRRFLRDFVDAAGQDFPQHVVQGLFGGRIHNVFVARKKGSDGSDPFFGSGSFEIGEAYCPPESGVQHDRDVVVIVRGGSKAASVQRSLGNHPGASRHPSWLRRGTA
jgi:hypothetical protein